jgi:hypothetical protein
MKNKSFLFLIAALALGLALLGCSTDSSDGDGYPVPGPKEGYLYSGLPDAVKIMLLFEEAPAVYLEDNIDLQGDALIIPSDKTLHVNGQTVTVDKDTVIVVQGTLDWDDKATSVISGTSAVVIVAGEVAETAHYSAGKYSEDNIFGINFGEIGKNKYAGSAGAGPWHTAATSFDDLIVGEAGTTGYLLGSFNGTTDFAPAGTLVVSGDLTLSTDKVIKSTAKIDVYGKVKGGTDATATLITGTVSAINAEISGGIIANDLLILRNGDFSGGGVTFKGKLEVLRDAKFANVKFEGDENSVANQATFTSGDLVAGSVTVGNLSFTGGSNNKLVLDENGEIIFTGGTTPTFFTGAGTLAALGGSVSFFVEKNKLTVDGDETGTFAVGNNGINLAAGNTIQIGAKTGVYFGGEGSIASANYSIGNNAGTMSADIGFILTPNGIEKTGSTQGTPKITFEAEEGKGILLSLREGLLATNTIRNAIIDGVNIELGDNGSIAVYENNLIITNGGSVTAGNIAWSGTIAGTAAGAGGSLLVGSLSAANISANTIPSGSITAGSIGTQSSTPGILVSNNVFIFTDATVIDGIGSTGVGDGGSASTGGSILVFSHP